MRRRAPEAREAGILRTNTGSWNFRLPLTTGSDHACEHMTYVSGRLGRALCQFSLAWIMVSCGGKSEDGGSLSQDAGGNTGTAVSSAQGGSSGGTAAASGGARPLGGASTGGVTSIAALTGGTANTSTGGSPLVGGSMGSGGQSPMGGSLSTGGKSATGGTTNSSGSGGTIGVVCGSSVCAPSQLCWCGYICDYGGATYACTGGSASTGGTSAHATGGNLATGGTGGTATSGGTLSNAGGFATGGSVGSGGTSGTTLRDFCQGSESKVSYKGQVASAPATNYQSVLPLSCCRTYGINLHASAAFGFDFAVELIWYAASTTATGVYQMGDSTCGTASCPLRAMARASTETDLMGHATSGSGELFTEYSDSNPWDFGFCLEVTDNTSDLFGARLYVPRITIVSWQASSRLQFFLPSDHSITPLQAAASSAPPVLETSAFLDLSDIAYVTGSKWEIGLIPGQKLGSSLVSRIGASTIALPFYVKADGVLIYMGSIGTHISEVAPVGPFVFTDNITDNSFAIYAPVSGTDSRNDPRILNVLSETSRLIP